MDTLKQRLATPVAIAAITTVVTTSLTQYLLTQPWCIKVRTNDVHQISYGANNCSTENEDAYPFYLTNTKVVSGAVIANRRAIWSDQ